MVLPSNIACVYHTNDSRVVDSGEGSSQCFNRDSTQRTPSPSINVVPPSSPFTPRQTKESLSSLANASSPSPLIQGLGPSPSFEEMVQNSRMKPLSSPSRSSPRPKSGSDIGGSNGIRRSIPTPLHAAASSASRMSANASGSSSGVAEKNKIATFSSQAQSEVASSSSDSSRTQSSTQADSARPRAPEPTANRYVDSQPTSLDFSIPEFTQDVAHALTLQTQGPYSLDSHNFLGPQSQ